MVELAYGIAGHLVDKLGSIALENVSRAWGMKEDLEKLEATTSTLKSVLLDAEKKQKHNEELKMWLVRLKDVFHDAENVLDEFECEVLRRQVVKEYGSVARKVRRFLWHSNPIAFRFSTVHQVKKIRERLDEIAAEMAKFQLITSQLNGQEDLVEGTAREKTYSFVNLSEVIGRDEDKDKIVDMLTKRNKSNGKVLSVIPIVGIGGLGKTTLAKSVYSDQRVVKMFDLRLWVSVPMDFNVTDLAREILKSAISATSGKIKNSSIDREHKTKDISNLSMELLQRLLLGILKNNKVFIVLDDVWKEDHGTWNEVRNFLLMVCAKGSKILLTTRSTAVASVTGTTEPHVLKRLSEANSLSLFLKCAFGDERLAERYPKLKAIGRQIVANCKGVPLALKSLGSLLYSKTNEREWILARDSEIWELKSENKDPILSTLRLSYSTLPSCLKRCFAYCSLVPKNVRVDSLDMIWKWMALGILQSPKKEMELEEVGRSHFKELCTRSFFEYLDDFNESLNLDQQFQMHDLIHGLAASIIQHEHSTVDSDTTTAISESVKYLAVFLNDKKDQRLLLKMLRKSKKVRSIFIKYQTVEEEPDIRESFLSECISRFRYLRVFDLRDLSFKILPSSIGTLKHLRYLNLRGNKKIKRLPESICHLQSLQTLILDECEKLEELPRDIRNLVSLRTLMVTTAQTYLPENGVGRLKSLQFLTISDCRNLQMLPRDIRYCTTLRSLGIFSCEKLNLAIGSDQVVELSLRKLLIEGLPQTTGLPQWLQGAARTLEILVIEGCPQLTALPEYWAKLLVPLTHLEIKDCEHLNLDVCGLEEDMAQLNLQTFIISKLPKVKALPWWLQGAAKALQTLVIDDCPELAALPRWLQKSTSLQKLVIVKCPKLQFLRDKMNRIVVETDLPFGPFNAFKESCKRFFGQIF